MNSLNLTAQELCKTIGIAYSCDLLKSLRELNLVSWFNVGKKRLYKRSDADKISQMLHEGKISIRTSESRYYVVLNK